MRSQSIENDTYQIVGVFKVGHVLACKRVTLKYEDGVVDKHYIDVLVRSDDAIGWVGQGALMRGGTPKPNWRTERGGTDNRDWQSVAAEMVRFGDELASLLTEVDLEDRAAQAGFIKLRKR